MMPSRVVNNPLHARQVNHSSAWWNGAFSHDELDALEQYCAQLELQPGSTVAEASQSISDYRKSNVRFVHLDDGTQWIFNKFNGVIDELNQRYFNFDLYGYDSFQYTVYDSSYAGKYDWHMDMIMGEALPDRMWLESPRKLSLVMPLNRPGVDYTGGEFQIHAGAEENCETLDMERGKIYAFPSFVIHRVKPVLTGVRKSIVIWVQGPKFR